MKPAQLQWVVTFLMLFLFSTATTVLCCVPTPAGLVGWWPTEGNADDSIGGNNGMLVKGVGFTNGMIDRAFSLGYASGYVSMGNNPYGKCHFRTCET
jgi:hypothetical protein